MLNFGIKHVENTNYIELVKEASKKDFCAIINVFLLHIKTSGKKSVEIALCLTSQTDWLNEKSPNE